MSVASPADRLHSVTGDSLAADVPFGQAMENSGVGMSLNTPDGRFVYANQALCDILGYDEQTLLTKTWQEVTPPTTLAFDIRRGDDVAAGIIDNYRTTKQYVHADGHLVWVDLSIGCTRGPDGELELYVAQIIDVTTEVEMRARQAEADARFRRLMETSNVGMALIGSDGKFQIVNGAICEMFGYDKETFNTKTWQELAPVPNRDADLKDIADLLAGRLDCYRVTKEYVHADGHPIWLDLSMSCLRDTDGTVQYLVAQGVDVSKEVNAREQLARQERENRKLADRLTAANAELRRLAITDALTGVYNRGYFNQRLLAEMARARRDDQAISLIILDVDHFKRINDAHGHPVGDEALIEVSRRIRASLRSVDVFARIGGEEFAVILPQCAGWQAAEIAEGLRALVADEPVPSVGLVTISLGLAELREADSASDWIKRADTAMYAAKRAGRNQVGYPSLSDEVDGEDVHRG